MFGRTISIDSTFPGSTLLESRIGDFAIIERSGIRLNFPTVDLEIYPVTSILSNLL
jgi:hypothetical protein